MPQTGGRHTLKQYMNQIARRKLFCKGMGRALAQASGWHPPRKEDVVSSGTTFTVYVLSACCLGYSSMASVVLGRVRSQGESRHAVPSHRHDLGSDYTQTSLARTGMNMSTIRGTAAS